MIERNIEEALNLRGVQVERDNAARSGAFEKIRGELRGDRDAPFVFAVLTRVSEVGYDGGNSRGARAADRVDHDEEFHERVVYRPASRLNDVYVFTAHVLFNSAERFAIGELLNGHLPHGVIKVVANLFEEGAICGAGKNLHLTRKHQNDPISLQAFVYPGGKTGAAGFAPRLRRRQTRFGFLIITLFLKISTGAR